MKPKTLKKILTTDENVADGYVWVCIHDMDLMVDEGELEWFLKYDAPELVGHMTRQDFDLMPYVLKYE